MLEVKFKQNINDIIEERADYGNVNTTVIQETLEMQPEELSESELIGINQSSEEFVIQRIKMSHKK